jgi:hypothetical protein
MIVFSAFVCPAVVSLVAVQTLSVASGIKDTSQLGNAHFNSLNESFYPKFAVSAVGISLPLCSDRVRTHNCSRSGVVCCVQ